ncbi:MAG: S8 family serine peptidase [Acidobacteriota bacterium]|nr:S8 family serine peptidase [Acidobacteriota bacterium]
MKIIGGSSKAAYNEKINELAEAAALFNPLTIGEKNLTDKDIRSKLGEKRFRGDNVSPDLREMMAQDSSGTRKVDVIIQAKDADNPVLRTILAENNVSLNDRIGDTDTIVVNLPLSAVNALSNSGLINYMSPDREIETNGHIESTSGASNVRSQSALNGRVSYTLDGSGVGIAIVDSGIMPTHKAFTQDGTTGSRIVYSQSFVAGVASTDDDYGHGTHVAAIAAGQNSRDTGAYRGVAYKANIINLKVLNSQGKGTTSALLNALNWIEQNHAAYNIKVVNISLGTPAIDSYYNDPLCWEVEMLNYYGILVVAAAGNNGKNSQGQKVYGQIHSPGIDPSVLTVGASNSFGSSGRGDDTLATYSSHGPTRSYYTDASGRHYDNVIKPDIVAPGNKIVSAKAKSTSYLITNNPTSTNSTLDEF